MRNTVARDVFIHLNSMRLKTILTKTPLAIERLSHSRSRFAPWLIQSGNVTLKHLLHLIKLMLLN